MAKKSTKPAPTASVAAAETPTPALRLVEPPPPAPAVPAANVTTIPLNLLIPSPANSRTLYDAETIAELASSIAAGGQLANLMVRGTESGFYETFAGERRRRALLLLAERGDVAADHPVACRLVDVDEEEALLLSLAENVGREDMTWWDQASGFRRVSDLAKARGEQGVTSRIAATAGCVKRRVEQLIFVDRNLVPAALELAKAGRLTFAHARAWASLEPWLQEAFAQLKNPPLAEKVSDLRAAYSQLRPEPLEIRLKDQSPDMIEDFAGLRTFDYNPGYSWDNEGYKIVVDVALFLERRDARIRATIAAAPETFAHAEARGSEYPPKWSFAGEPAPATTTAIRRDQKGRIETLPIAEARAIGQPQKQRASTAENLEPADETSQAFRFRAAAIQQSAAREHLLTSPRMALEVLALLVINSRAFADLSSDQFALDATYEDVDKQLFLDRATRFPKPIAAKLRKLKGEYADGSGYYGTGPETDQLAKAIHELSEEDLHALLYLAASHWLRTTRPHPSHKCGTSPTILYLARTFGIEIDPRVLEPTVFDGLRKARLVELAQESGAAGDRTEKELAKLRVDELRQLICDGRRTDWLPAEIKFHPAHQHGAAHGQ